MPARRVALALHRGHATAKQVRFGRLVVGNAHGSERLPLDVPLRTEYWGSAAGSTGFILSAGDACTALLTSDIVLAPDPLGLGTAVSAVTGPLGSAVWRITLQAPGATGYTGVRPNLSAGLLPHLRGDWDNDGNWAEDGDDPTGRGSFGLHQNETRRVYQREVIGN